MMNTAFGDAFAAFVATSRTMPALMFSSSSRVIPGLRGRPEVMTTTSESFVSAQLLVPMIAGGEADVRGLLGEVERLALRQALDDVLQDDVDVAGLGQLLGHRAAGHAGADDRYLCVASFLLYTGLGRSSPAHYRALSSLPGTSSSAPRGRVAAAFP